LRSPVEQEIHELIRVHGRITFAQFMHLCLYSRRGGFYASRRSGIGTHFGTASLSHPVFGALIARQLEQMWRLLGAPSLFHLIEVGCGDGALAQSILHASGSAYPEFARALYYVGADYAPHRLQSVGQGPDWQPAGKNFGTRSTHGLPTTFTRVSTSGLQAFRSIVGCILSNELLDNFPVHRFAVHRGRIMEVYVALSGDRFVESLGEPSSPRIASRLTELGIVPCEGHRGEICLVIEDWVRELSAALERGFAMTIDYGDRSRALYAPRNAEGTLVCYHRHAALADPFQNIGWQDITCHVDFSALMEFGERNGLATAGYTRQSDFLRNLGFDGLLKTLQSQGLSAARTELSRLAMMTLVEPEEYGDFKVLAQSKGLAPGVALEGFLSPTP